MFFPEYVWVPGSNQTRRCTSWAWRRTTRTGSVQCWGFFLWISLSNRSNIQHFDQKLSKHQNESWTFEGWRWRSSSSSWHQAKRWPSSSTGFIFYKNCFGFQKDWIMIATKLKLNIFAKIYKDFLFVRTAMLIGSSKEHIWKNFDLWSLFGFGLRSSSSPHHSAQRYGQFWCFPKDWCMSSFKTEERHSSFIDHILNGGSILLKFPDTLFEESAREPDDQFYPSPCFWRQ